MYSIYKSTVIRLCILVVCLFIGVGVMGIYTFDAYAASASVRIINTSGSGAVTMTVKNISNEQPATNGLITWSNIKAGQTVWKVADQYIEISHTGLPADWGMQIYTDNKDIAANPKYTGTADPAGLVKTNNTIVSLPMAWRITDKPPSKYTSAKPYKPEEDPYNLANVVERDDHKGMTNYLWHFMKDKNSPDDDNTLEDERFTNGQDYVTLWNQSGIAWNEGGRATNPKKAYIYFAAKFIMASIGAEYKTSTLTIEAYQGISPFPIYLYKDAPKTEYPNEQGATLDNHFAPSGFMNYSDSHKIITVNPRCKEVAPHSGTHCFKIHWNGNAGVDGNKWGGIMWLEPEDIWAYEPNQHHPTHNGYDLRGARCLSFYARTDSANVGLQINAYFGNSWDSCEEGASIKRSPALTTEWQQYPVHVSLRDMKDVTGGLAVIFNADRDPDPDGCTIYLDDIKFDNY